jgi:hypothetical protein
VRGAAPVARAGLIDATLPCAIILDVPFDGVRAFGMLQLIRADAGHRPLESPIIGLSLRSRSLGLRVFPCLDVIGISRGRFPPEPGRTGFLARPWSVKPARHGVRETDQF